MRGYHNRHWVRLWTVLTLSVSGWPGAARDLLAQAGTTGTLRGTVRAEHGGEVEGTWVRVEHLATGFFTETAVRNGRFLVSGLEIGGPYVVVLRRIGFVPQRSEPVFLALGERVEMEFVLRPAATPLDTVLVVGHAATAVARVQADPGLGTTISDSLVHRLPSLNRDFTDFVRLVPQVSTKVPLRTGGMSAGGSGARLNNFLLDGVPERFLSPNAPLSWSGGRSISIEAVRETQVLLSPYDVRFGDFTGGLVNTVTKSGTNELRGGAFAYVRSDRLARGGELGSAPYRQGLFGFSLGGPLLRNRLHFFLAPELQRTSSPAEGPYLGQAAGARPPVPVSPADLARFDSMLRGYGLVAGSAGPVENQDPVHNLFARLDAALPGWKSRVMASLNYGDEAVDIFSRASRDTFSLSSYQFRQPSRSRLASVHLETSLRRAGGGSNHLSLSHLATGGDLLPKVREPLVLVAVPGTSGGTVTVKAGTQENAQGRFNRARTIRLADDLTLPLSATHTATLGLAVERFRLDRGGVRGSYGTWTFGSLDSLGQGIPERFQMSKDFGSATVPLVGGQYALYAEDHWRVAPGFSLTLGLRADLLTLSGRPPYNATVDSVFQRRTDQLPRETVELSPRLGFVWDPSSTGREQLRGGAGIFTGRPPLFWIHPALYSYGFGIGSLSCGRLPTDGGPPPGFVPDYRTVPTACANGSEVNTTQQGDVDLLDPGLRMARALRASLAYDRRLPGDLLATSEVLFTRNLADFVFVNLNLPPPQATDRHGRVMYGIRSSDGIAVPQRRSGFSEVIGLTNTSRNQAYQLTQRIERPFAHGLSVTASYTYSHVRDVQTPWRVGVPGREIWATAGAVSGRHDALAPGISQNDIPHRVVVALTLRAPWRRWFTQVAFYYVGESGSPFTYVAGGTGGRGDLNADGSNANDPIYVPSSALDQAEIVFSGRSDSAGADNSPAAQAMRVAAQQAGLEAFIRGSACLARQRGRILERNSCREPFSHLTTASVRQTIPVSRGVLEAELDVFNLLNLLDGDWGLYRVAAAPPTLLQHVGETPGGGATSEAQPVFQFDPRRADWSILRAQSAFQLQLALRYRF